MARFPEEIICKFKSCHEELFVKTVMVKVCSSTLLAWSLADDCNMAWLDTRGEEISKRFKVKA